MNENPYSVDFTKFVYKNITTVCLSWCKSKYKVNSFSCSKTYTRKMFCENSKVLQVASMIPSNRSKIGIVIFNKEDVVMLVVCGASTNIFGYKNNRVIHIGEIKAVYKNLLYFFHDINMVKSYFGAIVFLLDKSQHDCRSIPQEDFGKAVILTFKYCAMLHFVECS